jgi:dolichol-phosphate mannosyltransferase
LRKECVISEERGFKLENATLDMLGTVYDIFNNHKFWYICLCRSVLETINLDKIQFVGYAFQIEMKFKTWKSGFDILEVPVVFTDRKEGYSKMDTSIFFEAFIGVIQMKIRSLFIILKQKPHA